MLTLVYARGLDGLWPVYQWLDRAPKGRNEPDYWFRLWDADQVNPGTKPELASKDCCGVKWEGGS